MSEDDRNAALTGGSPNVSGDEILRLQDIRKSFGAAEVLKGVSLSVKRGEVIAIIGASGSGKSTLLRCCNLLEVPTSGSVVFEGKNVDYYAKDSTWRRNSKLRSLRSSIGMVFQTYNLWPHMTVLENVIEGPIQVKGVARVQAVDEAERLLASIGLSTKRNEYPARLSGGQQQRVAIVRALAMRPKMMLFDEVTSALDPELVGEVLDLMRELANQGMTMLVVTHEMGFARHVGHRVAFVHGGEIAEIGTSADVLTRPQNERTRQFLARVLHKDAVI